VRGTKKGLGALTPRSAHHDSGAFEKRTDTGDPTSVRKSPATEKGRTKTKSTNRRVRATAGRKVPGERKFPEVSRVSLSSKTAGSGYRFVARALQYVMFQRARCPFRPEITPHLGSPQRTAKPLRYFTERGIRKDASGPGRFHTGS